MKDVTNNILNLDKVKESLMTFEEDGYVKNDELFLDEFHNQLVEKLETSFVKNIYRKIAKFLSKLKLKIVYQITMVCLILLSLINKDSLINELLQKYLTVKRGQRINNTACNSKSKISYEGVDYFALENKLLKIERKFSFGKIKSKILNKIKKIISKYKNTGVYRSYKRFSPFKKNTSDINPMPIKKYTCTMCELSEFINGNKTSLIKKIKE